MCCGSQSHSRSPEQRSSRSSLVEGQPVRTSLLIPCLEHVANAASRRRPARAGASSVVEDRGAHKGQTDRQLVGGGQGDYRLPRVERGARTMGGEVRAGRREGLWVVARRKWVCTQGRSDSRLGGQGTRGAHLEHVVHVRDLGGVPAQRLVEGVRVLPSRKGGAYAMCGARCGPGGGRAWGGGGASGVHGEKARLKTWGPEGTRGAHVEHVVHDRDLGGVKAQRLVQLLRALPAEARSMRYGARCGRGGGG